MTHKLIGIALLWAGLAALVNVAVDGEGVRGILVAALGFLAFAAGLQLFADGFKRQAAGAVGHRPAPARYVIRVRGGMGLF